MIKHESGLHRESLPRRSQSLITLSSLASSIVLVGGLLGSFWNISAPALPQRLILKASQVELSWRGSCHAEGFEECGDSTILQARHWIVDLGTICPHTFCGLHSLHGPTSSKQRWKSRPEGLGACTLIQIASYPVKESWPQMLPPSIHCRAARSPIWDLQTRLSQVSILEPAEEWDVHFQEQWKHPTQVLQLGTKERTILIVCRLKALI